jgi:hypothetical protein
MINMSQAKRWSCCKSVKPDAPGCKTDYHVEDTEFTKFLVDSYAQINSSSTPAVSASTAASLPSKLHFPPKKTISCEKRSPESNLPEKSTNGTGLGDVCVAEGGPPSPDSAADSTSDKPSCEPPSDLGAVVRHRHVVQTNDSIMKLCLLYNVSAELILSTNEIFHEKDIHTREFLIIPRFSSNSSSFFTHSLILGSLVQWSRKSVPLLKSMKKLAKKRKLFFSFDALSVSTQWRPKAIWRRTIGT